MLKNVPESFWYEPFYQKGDSVHIDGKTPFAERQWGVAFAEDMMSEVSPWFKPYEYVKSLCEKFHQEKGALSVLYKKRCLQEATVDLIKAKALLIQCVCWLNHEPVTLTTFEEDLIQYLNKPINAVERIGFILTHNHYLSFIQLCELMDELERLNERLFLLSSHG